MGADHDPGMDTPLAPLPDPREEPVVTRAPAPDGLRASFGAGVGHAVRSWRPLLLLVMLQLLLALTVVVPFHVRVAARLDAHAHAPALSGTPDAFDEELGWASGLDPGIWRDVKRLEAATFEGLGLVLFWTVVVAWLFGAVAAGGFLGTQGATEGGIRVRSFLAAGGAGFGRMVRVGLVFLLATYLIVRLVFDLGGGLLEDTEREATTAAVGWWASRAREAVFLLLFLALRVAADVARADLIVTGRRSALFAFGRGVGTVVRHPVRTLGLGLWVGMPAFAVLLALGVLSRAMEGPGGLALGLGFLLVQVAVLVRWASRAALLGGFASMVRARGSSVS